jgi:Putative zinc-finger
MADLARHPDVVDLAEYAEGVLNAARRSEVELHVRECPDCAETVADLAGLPETLAQAPIPPLPTEVAERLDRAIAAEASARAATPPAAARSTVVPMRPRRRWLKPVLAAAAAIGVIGLAVPVFNGGSDDAGGESAASSGDDSGQSLEESGGDADLPDAALVPTRPPSLSSDSFGRDVANAFFPREDKAALRTKSPAQAEDLTADGLYALQRLCPSPTDAEPPSGRVEAIRLDGAPANLLLDSTGSDTHAIAFTCDGPDAQILATATLTTR